MKKLKHTTVAAVAGTSRRERERRGYSDIYTQTERQTTDRRDKN